MEPLPSINKVLYLLIQQKMKMNLPMEEPRTLADADDNCSGRDPRLETLVNERWKKL